MPFVRSYDENNGRVVYNYNPETCGYVSFVFYLKINIDNINSLFDLELVVIEKVVDQQVLQFEILKIQLYYLNQDLKVEI